LKPLTVDVFGIRHGLKPGGGDSGYNSTPGNNGESNGVTVEARLMPHSTAGHGKFKSNDKTICLRLSRFYLKIISWLDDTISVVSEESVMLDQSPIQPSEFAPVYGLPDSTKISLLNSSKAGIELRFMQQLMWEAG